MAERTPTVHVAARVPIELGTALERMAVSEDRTISQELRRAIRRYVSENVNGSPDSGAADLTRPEQEGVVRAS